MQEYPAVQPVVLTPVSPYITSADYQEFFKNVVCKHPSITRREKNSIEHTCCLCWTSREQTPQMRLRNGFCFCNACGFGYIYIIFSV